MKKIKSGDTVVLLVGSKQYRGKSYKIAKINGDYAQLEGYKTAKRTKKITQDNTENFVYLPVAVHLSNLAISSDSVVEKISDTSTTKKAKTTKKKSDKI